MRNLNKYLSLTIGIACVLFGISIWTGYLLGELPNPYRNMYAAVAGLYGIFRIVASRSRPLP